MPRNVDLDDRIVYIYVLIDPRDIVFNPRYVGITVQGVNRRLQKHISDSTKYRIKVSNWIRVLSKDSVVPLALLVDVVYSWKEACEIEIGLINSLRKKQYRLLNLTNGGEGTLGSPRPKNEEFRIKSALTREKNKDNYKKVVMSEEQKKRLSIAMTGRKHSPERRLAQSIKQTGSKHPHRKGQCIYCGKTCGLAVLKQRHMDNCKLNPNRLPHRTEVCPFCNLESESMAMMKRWHFDNCKFKP